MRKLKTALQSRTLFKFLTAIVVLMSIITTRFIQFKSKINTKETTFIGRIINQKIDGDKTTITLKAQEKIIVNYYFKTKNEKNTYQKNFKLGDKIIIKGKIISPNNIPIPN